MLILYGYDTVDRTGSIESRPNSSIEEVEKRRNQETKERKKRRKQSVIHENNQTEEIHVETAINKSRCEPEKQKKCKDFGEEYNRENSRQQSHVIETSKVHFPSLPHNPLSLYPQTSCCESAKKADDHSKESNNFEDNSGKDTTGLLKDINVNVTGNNDLVRNENCNKSKTADQVVENGGDVTKAIKDYQNSDSEKDEIPEEAKTDLEFIETGKENDRSIKVFNLDSNNEKLIGNRKLTAITEVPKELERASDENFESVSIDDINLNCERCDGDENPICNSLDVDFDSGSVNTISDEGEEYLCVQYSKSDLLKDANSSEDIDQLFDCYNSIDDKPDVFDKFKKCNETDNTDRKIFENIGDFNEYNSEKSDSETPVKPDSISEVKADTKTEEKSETKSEEKPETKSEEKPETKTEEKPETKTEEKPETKSEEKPETKSEEELEIKSEVTTETKVEVKPDTNSAISASEFKILKYFQAGSVLKEKTESDFSGFESFYSLDNTGTGTASATAGGTPVAKRLKKTLTWTPRVLSEERFANSRSTTLSSDVASFYTADTYGTFYSACSFQLDSYDDFVTCEDFQKIDFNEEPKSKLSKAKDVLVKGRDFVKSKIEFYRKRLPNLGNRDIKSRILCRNSCGFSCVQVGKEISLYSIPDTQASPKRVNEAEIKGGNNINYSIEEKEDKPNKINDEANCRSVMNQDSGVGMTIRKNLEENQGQIDNEGSHTGRAVEFERGNRAVDGPSVGKRCQVGSTDQNGEDKMDSMSRETTEDNDDDLPVGTEATTINQERISRGSSESEDSRAKKRLRWVSAIERTQGTSLTSSLTTNSSVDQLLYQREMDPELLLSNLGFGGGPQADDTYTRIPDRFLLNQSAAGGVDQYQLVMDHPELHHLLPVMGTSQLMQGTNRTTDENKQEVAESGARNQSARKGSMQRPTFSSVAHGMKFIRGASMQLQPSPEEDEESKMITSIPSVLDFQNRKALAHQGFYGMEFASKELKEHADAKALKRTMSAAEKRKKFLHSAKSRGNWSLTDESEESPSKTRLDTTTSEDSWDRGLMLKSFSDRFSSDSSLESLDSYSEERRDLRRHNSIKNLRRQYEETIMKSIDGDVFTDMDEVRSPAKLERRKSLSEIRKHQVDRLMSSFDDDGDYTAQVRPPTLRELDPRSALVIAQNSTQSTITGSPLTPNDMTFSFEQGLNDGEEEFGFKSTERPGKLSQQTKQTVSIIVEEEISQQESTQTRGVTQKQNSNELNLLSLRTDSCNTLVPQDSEAIDGDLTPRAGDALSESASSSATLSTVIHDQQLDADLDQVERSRSQDGRSDDEYLSSRSTKDKYSLKPIPYPPQESFELEEISSAENAFEDWNGNIGKSSFRRGPMEKSASTHSDSSGFADLDTVGETTLPGLEMSKEHYLSHPRSTEANHQTDSKFKSLFQSHDSEFTQNATQSHPVGMQKRFTKQPLDEISETIEKQNVNSLKTSTPKDLIVCKKYANRNEDKENNPTLSSITYSRGGAADKSVIFTLSVPIETKKTDQPKPSRYVSSVSLDIQKKSKDNEPHRSKVTQVGQVKFDPVKSKSDLAHCSRRQFAETKKGDYNSLDNVLMDKMEIDMNQNYQKFGNEDRGCASPFRVKQEIVEKQRHKKELINANSHTADWLLNSEKHLQTESRGFLPSRPAWASTPDLIVKKTPQQYSTNSSRHIKTEGNHSFDLLLQEEPGTNVEESVSAGNHFGQAYSVDELDSRQNMTELGSRLRLSELRGDSACSSMDESVEISRHSMIGSSYSMPDDLNYLRLVQLVNGPSHLTDISKMPNAKFTPNFYMKNWSHHPRRKHLEEETLLMQHAVQRYKTELCLMENMLFALYRTAQEELEPEDREEVEELQHLWCEVRKEVIKMEELLASRLKSIMAGNETYSPLDGLEIIQTMIDLLREQLYHQQMCMGRDISFTEDLDDLPSRSQSVLSTGTSSSISESWMSDISSQVAEIKSTLETAEQSQKQELQERISELKKSLLSEVKSESSSTQNSKMLQLQLQARDNEIRRLKMELLLQNVNSGATRKKQTLESDV